MANNLTTPVFRPYAKNTGTVINQELSVTVNITVKRAPADLPAEAAIVDPILTDVRAALARGQTEIDKGESLPTVPIVIPYNATIQLSDLVKVRNVLTGVEWFGTVTTIEHNGDGQKVLTHLTIEKGTELGN